MSYDWFTISVQFTIVFIDASASDDDERELSPRITKTMKIDRAVDLRESREIFIAGEEFRITAREYHLTHYGNEQTNVELELYSMPSFADRLRREFVRNGDWKPVA